MTVSGKSSRRKSGNLLDFLLGPAPGREAGVGRRPEMEEGMETEATVGVPALLGPWSESSELSSAMREKKKASSGRIGYFVATSVKYSSIS